MRLPRPDDNRPMTEKTPTSAEPRALDGRVALVTEAGRGIGRLKLCDGKRARHRWGIQRIVGRWPW
jgi:hypothetical protein